MSSWRVLLGIDTVGTEPTEGTQPPFVEGSVGCVGSVPEQANAANGTSAELAAKDTPGRDPARWDRFVMGTVALGITVEELSRHFPHEEDREDIRLTPDADILQCARTIADAVMRERVSVNVAYAPSAARQAVQCAECRHFVRRSVAVGYGTCVAGVPSTGARVLHFATRRHPCGAFDEVSR